MRLVSHEFENAWPEISQVHPAFGRAAGSCRSKVPKGGSGLSGQLVVLTFFAKAFFVVYFCNFILFGVCAMLYKSWSLPAKARVLYHKKETKERINICRCNSMICVIHHDPLTERTWYRGCSWLEQMACGRSSCNYVRVARTSVGQCVGLRQIGRTLISRKV